MTASSGFRFVALLTAVALPAAVAFAQTPAPPSPPQAPGLSSAAENSASGLTGKPEYSVGRVAPSLPYAYRMRGQFTETSGKATRIELRPCRASFRKT